MVFAKWPFVIFKGKGEYAALSLDRPCAPLTQQTGCYDTGATIHFTTCCKTCFYCFCKTVVRDYAKDGGWQTSFGYARNDTHVGNDANGIPNGVVNGTGWNAIMPNIISVRAALYLLCCVRSKLFDNVLLQFQGFHGFWLLVNGLFDKYKNKYCIIQ